MCLCRSYNRPKPSQTVPSVVLDVPEWAKTPERQTVAVDACIAPAVQALWSERIWTLGSCCGHGGPGRSIIVDRSDRARAASVLRAMGETATVLAWELLAGDGGDDLKRPLAERREEP